MIQNGMFLLAPSFLLCCFNSWLCVNMYVWVCVRIKSCDNTSLQMNAAMWQPDLSRNLVENEVSKTDHWVSKLGITQTPAQKPGRFIAGKFLRSLFSAAYLFVLNTQFFPIRLTALTPTHHNSHQIRSSILEALFWESIFMEGGRVGMGHMSLLRVYRKQRGTEKDKLSSSHKNWKSLPSRTM